MQRQATEADADTLLDETLVSDPARLEAARQKAAEPPPSTDDADTLVRFYATRADAARIAGSPQQWLEDMREAAKHLPRSTTIDRVDVLMRLGNAEGNTGTRPLAIRAYQEAIAQVPSNRRPRTINIYAQIAEHQVRLGNIEAAEASIASARAVIREVQNNPRFQINPGIRRAIAMVEGATAMVQDFRGNYAAGEASHRKAIEELQYAGQPQDQNRITQRRQLLAMNLRAQGRLAEAENESRQALAEAQRQGGASSPRTAGSLVNLAVILADQGRAAESESLIRKSLEMFGPDAPQARNARQALANALAVQGKWREALAEYDTLRQSFGRNRQEQGFENFARRNVFFPVALLKGGRAAEARQRLETMVEINKGTLGDKHAVTAESRGFLAMALAETGQRERALPEFVEAVSVLLLRSREASDTEDTGSASAQDQRTRLILESYIDLLADLRSSDLPARHKIDPVAESFRLADAAKGRSVLRALAASAARAAAANPQLADIARRVQDAEKQISALNGLLANAISARAQDQDAGAIRDLRRRIDGLRDERGRLMQDIERRFPDYAKLVNPQPATIEDVRRTLRPGEAMVALLAGEKRSYAWVVPQSGAPALVAAALDRAQLAAAVTGLRKAVDPNAQTLDDIPAFDVAVAHRLYAALLQPAEAAWRDAQSLFVVPDGALGQLPLGLLVTAPTTLAAADRDGVPFSRYRDVPWLIKRAAVTQLPSVGSLAALRALPAAPGTRRPFIGFGDPWFSKEQAQEAAQEAQVQTAALTTRGVRIKLRSAPKASGDYSAEYAMLPRLPDTADEVKAIATVLRSDARDVILGDKASTSVVKKTDLSSARIVMFATHGLVPGDLSGLNQPALALSAPEVTGNPADGLLTVEDILALRLNADWVVLSACNTASGQGAGAEAVSGLGRAFFYAGTRALLVSNWPVESTSARALTTDLFRRQAENPALRRAEAMRQAMVALIDGPGLAGGDGKPLFSYAHPIFWAPFSLIGDGGGPAK